MRILPPLLLGLFAFFLVAGSRSIASAQDSWNASAEEVSRAVALLDNWHGDNTEGSDRVLHLVYWTPKDREAVPGYRERLSGILLDIQGFYADEMQRLGFGRRSFNLQLEPDRLAKIHLVTGHHPSTHYDVQSGREIREECLPVLEESGIDPAEETIMIFCNLADWDEEKRIFRHKSPYYASGGPRNGTAWQLDSPTLAIDRIRLKEPKLNDGQYGNISMGKHNSIFIGGIAHELGHALGLPHCRETPEEKKQRGTALMGAGNRTYGDDRRGEGRGSFLTLAHAFRLASHPQFSGSTRGLQYPVKATVENFEASVEGKRILVRGRASASIPIYAVVAYFDPEGGSDYDAYTASAILDDSGNFTLSSPALPPNQLGTARVFPLLANGTISEGGMSRTPFRFPYRTDEKGVPDLTSQERHQALSPLLSSLRKQERKEAGRLGGLLAHYPDPLVREIARNLLAENGHPLPSPAEFDSNSRAVLLSRCTPSEQRVGWIKPFYDRTPAPTFVLESGGELHSSGIYAHAPAAHSWKLGKKWTRLTGSAGVAEGHRGRVVFSIFVDGMEKWKSKPMQAGRPASFDVDLRGAETLRLVVGDAGDGNGGDWGLWLNPALLP